MSFAKRNSCIALRFAHGLVWGIAIAHPRELPYWSNSPARCAREEERRDSNPQPLGPQPSALTDCATLPMWLLLYAREDSNLRPAA